MRARKRPSRTPWRAWSAVAGLNKCVAQHRSHTPKPVWNPDLPVTESYRAQWLEVPANDDLDNGFKLQWEEFLAERVGSSSESMSRQPQGAH